MFFYKYCRPFLKARQRFVPSTASSSSSITTPTLTVDSLRAGAKVVHPGVISCFPGKTYTGLDKDEIKYWHYSMFSQEIVNNLFYSFIFVGNTIDWPIRDPNILRSAHLPHGFLFWNLSSRRTMAQESIHPFCPASLG